MVPVADLGNAEDACQPVTLMFTIGGVDMNRVWDFQRDHGFKLESVWAEAQKNGDMRPFQSVIPVSA